MIFVARVEFKTILFDFLPSSVVKIILVINLVMTILISVLLIIGAIRVGIFLTIVAENFNTNVIIAKPLYDAAMGNIGNNVCHWSVNFCNIHRSRVFD